MDEKEIEHSKENLIWSGTDYQNRSVSLYVADRDHILDRHGEIMGNNFTAIYDTVENPDSVYESGEFDNREVFFKKSTEATYGQKFLTKAVVEYNENNTSGFIVTSLPTKKEGGNVGQRIYPKDKL